MMFRVLTQPRWALGLLVALITIVGFIGLGLWQLDRHAAQQSRNVGLAATDVQVGLVEGGSPYQKVQVKGRWVEEATFELVPRYRDGVLGAAVVSVLEVESGELLAVDRGWTSVIGSLPAPDSSQVTAVGRLIEASGAGSEPLAPGRYGRLDLAALSDALGRELYPLALVAESLEPGSAELATNSAPVPSTTPHLGYAYQWFAFAGIVAVGFLLLIRKVAR